MRPADNIKRLIKNLSDTTSAEMDERVIGDVLRALEESKKTSALIQPNIRRTIMKSPITKLAAAAMIIIVVLISIIHYDSGTSVAWGEVIKNVEASPGFIYQLRQTYIQKEKGANEIHINARVYGSSEYGIRMDSCDPNCPVQTYGNIKEKTLTTIMHSSKTYSRTPLPDDDLAELERLEPREAVRELLSGGYRKLGRKTIEGIEAEGIEIDDPSKAKANFQVDSCVIQLWVAVDTGLPILIEVDTVGKDGTLEVHTVQDNFQWNVELDASEFEPDIPEDYTLMEVEIDADGGASFKTTVKYDSQEVVGAKIHKWRVTGKDPESGYLLESEDGQSVTSIPESWADSPEHAVRVQEELDLQKQQGNRELVVVTEIEVNGQLDYRVLMYEHNLLDGQTVRISDFDPDDTSQWTVINERQEELNQLLRERRRQEEKGQELATTEERQVYGRVFTFKKRRFVLSDGTEVIHSIGRLKDD